ncbi:MAG: tetratricopeptide repeat protein [Planctomycetes bacterium]|nr:tetratricopeptide repeat protein [Planctomycetota bacterium]
MKRTRIFLFALVFYFFTAPAWADEEPKKTPSESKAAADSAEDRLLKAELLEVSTGDLEKAMGIYRTISGDEKVPESTRARALLYLARCHRKLGEIEAAKKLLEELVKTHARERDILRQAQSFLRELSSGKPENPDFDWLKELEKSPEIQARVFDLAMNLVNLESDEGWRAYSQLLALGTLAAPVLERLVETSRDARQRFVLAMLLLRSGRYERLAAALETISAVIGGTIIGGAHRYQNIFSDFLKSIPGLPEEERRRLLEAVGRIPSGKEVEPYQELVRLWAGDTGDLPARLKKVIAAVDLFYYQQRLRTILDQEPAVKDLLARWAVDPEVPKDSPGSLLRFLMENAPEKLAAAHWLMELESLKGLHRYRGTPGPIRLDRPEDKEKYRLLQELEKLGAFGALKEIAAGELGNYAVNWFWYRYGSAGKLKEAPAGWAAVLRAAGKISLKVELTSKASVEFECGLEPLHHLAERNDAAIPEFAGALRNRAREFPEYFGYGERQKLEGDPERWQPSPRYVEAMAGLLETPDPVVQSIALEALAEAPAETAPEVFERVEKLLAAPSDPHAREFALYALLKRFLLKPELGPKAARLFLGEWSERAKASEIPEAYGSSPADKIGILGYAERQHVASTPPGLGPRALQIKRPISKFRESLAWLIAREKYPALLYPHILALAGSEEGIAFHEWYFRTAAHHEAIAQQLIERLDTVKDLKLQVSVVDLIDNSFYKKGLSPKIADFLCRGFLNRDLPTEARVTMLTNLFAEPQPYLFDRIDWAKLLDSDDPVLNEFADRLGNDFWWEVQRHVEQGKSVLYQAALKSPAASIRSLLLKHPSLNEEEREDWWKQALKDPEPGIRQDALNYLARITRADIAPLFLRSLEDPDAGVRQTAVRIIMKFTLPESVEALGKLLNDPDIKVRNEALMALKEIRQALEEKKEWDDLLKNLQSKGSAEKNGKNEKN